MKEENCCKKNECATRAVTATIAPRRRFIKTGSAAGLAVILANRPAISDESEDGSGSGSGSGSGGINLVISVCCPSVQLAATPVDDIKIQLKEQTSPLIDPLIVEVVKDIKTKIENKAPDGGWNGWSVDTISITSNNMREKSATEIDYDLNSASLDEADCAYSNPQMDTVGGNAAIDDFSLGVTIEYVKPIPNILEELEYTGTVNTVIDFGSNPGLTLTDDHEYSHDGNQGIFCRKHKEVGDSCDGTETVKGSHELKGSVKADDVSYNFTGSNNETMVWSPHDIVASGVIDVSIEAEVTMSVLCEENDVYDQDVD